MDQDIFHCFYMHLLKIEIPLENWKKNHTFIHEENGLRGTLSSNVGSFMATFP